MTGAPAQTPDITEEVRDAVLAVPGVLALSAGTFGEVGTYLAGRRIDGVRLLRGRCEVHVVARFGTNLTTLAQLIRNSLAPLVGVPVDVTVADVATDLDVAEPATTRPGLEPT